MKSSILMQDDQAPLTITNPNLSKPNVPIVAFVAFRVACTVNRKPFFY
jgi:hypothetical protein